MEIELDLGLPDPVAIAYLKVLQAKDFNTIMEAANELQAAWVQESQRQAREINRCYEIIESQEDLLQARNDELCHLKGDVKRLIEGVTKIQELTQPE